MTAALENVHMVVAAAAKRGVPPGKLLAAVGLDLQGRESSEAAWPDCDCQPRATRSESDHALAAAARSRK